jgi:hypothetical protein
MHLGNLPQFVAPDHVPARPVALAIWQRAAGQPAPHAPTRELAATRVLRLVAG